MKAPVRLVIALAVAAAGTVATYFWGRKRKTSHAVPFDPALAASVFGKKIKADDLTVIEGIGPKIAGLFRGAGIRTWQGLSEASVARCQEILDSAPGFALHDPADWPTQAKLAAHGQWQELKNRQSS